MLICAFKDVMLTVGGIAIAVLILLLMITIHEFGHYIAGRKLGFKINEFAIGFGPKLFSKKNKHGIVISLRAFPLGGFCAFEDDDGDIVNKYVEGGNQRAREEAAKEPSPDPAPAQSKSEGLKFSEQKPWKRMIVLAMGAIFNILSAVIFTFIMLLAIGNTFKTTAVGVAEVYSINADKPQVVAVSENPNYGVGEDKLHKEDIIIEVNGVRLEKVKNFSSQNLSDIIGAAGDSFEIIVKRGGTELPLTVQKWKYTYLEEGKDSSELTEKTGLGFSMYGVYKNDYNVLTALRDCVPVTFQLAGMILSALGQLFTTATGIRQMGGTVTTIAVIGKTAAANLSVIFLWLPLIAVNLGVFNLLPVPALDGCRIVICGIEWIRRKPLNRKVEGWIHAIGFIVLIGFVIVMDILQLFVFKQF